MLSYNCTNVFETSLTFIFYILLTVLLHCRIKYQKTGGIQHSANVLASSS